MTALICNIIVVSSSVYLFHRHAQLPWRKAAPLLLLSVPFAYLGGRYVMAQQNFYVLLGGTLLIAAIIMLIDSRTKAVRLPRFFNAGVGGGIGFLSGLVGIGGGIFLSPLLHLSRWAAPKVIAATSAIFILVNSIAGLTGQIMTNGFALEFSVLLPLLIAVFIGGQVGVRLTIYKFQAITVRRISAIVIIIVAVRLLLQ